MLNRLFDWLAGFVRLGDEAITFEDDE